MNSSIKFTLGGVIAVIVIISSITTALTLLKDENIENFLTISKLNARSMSKEINQDIVNIEQTILNITSVIEHYVFNININNRLNEMILKYPQIRSVNILEKGKVIYSSNLANKDLTIDNLNLYPKPIFDDNILKISTPWIGRDFDSASDVYNNEVDINSKENYFIPISKNIETSKGVFQVVVNLNTDYFINRFLANVDDLNKVTFELVRLDGVLLLSTNYSESIGKVVSKTILLDKAIEKNSATGIENINDREFISSYILTNNYPLYLNVKLDLEQNLLKWNEKQSYFLVVISLIVVFSMLTALVFFYLFNKKQEEEIEAHRLQLIEHNKFKLLFQDSHFLATVIDDEGFVVDANNNALKFLDKSLDSLNLLKFWELACWDYKERTILKNLITSKKLRKSFSSELKAFTTENKIMIIDFNLAVLNDDGKRYYIAIGLDITQRKQREEKLLQAYTVFDNTRDGIMITDANSNILDVNNAFEKITAYKKSEIINKNTRILKSNLHGKEFYDDMWSSIKLNGFWEGEITNLNKKREYYTIWLTINAIYGHNRKVSNYIGVFSDITEQKHKDELLKEKEKVIYQQSKMAAMGEMIENIAHQWRQPLSMITMVSSGLKMKKELGVLSNEEYVKDLDSINDSAQFLSDTIDDFRSYLKNDKVKEPFDIYEAIEYSLTLLSSKFKNRNIEIIKKYEHIEVLGIRNELVQVMMNILSNSKDILENLEIDEKYIVIESLLVGDNLKIVVKDNGGGIKDEIIDRVFEPYFTTKHQSQGTGIGLYMSEQIVRNHMNGTISVKNSNFEVNTKVCYGACFIIEIPLD